MNDYECTTHAVKIKLSRRARWMLFKHRARRWWRLRRMTIEQRQAFLEIERKIDEDMTRLLLYGSADRD